MQRKNEPSKILLVGLYKDSNLGDKVIFDCTKYLLEQKENCSFEKLYLSPKLSFLERVLRKLYSKIVGEKKAFKLLAYFFQRRFYKKIKNADKIFFVGGGIIKWRYQFFWAQIFCVIKVAEKYNKKVFFNAVGVEGYNEKDWRCKILKNAINSQCVKLITTRDDIDLLNSFYLTNKNIKTFKCADPAVFVSKVYNIQKNKSDIIGIGLIRKNIFTDNAMNFSSEQVLNLYVSFIKLLQSKNVKFELFINGLLQDLELAQQICKECSLDEKSISIPKDEKDLVKIISDYKCVVSGRLHACIISYSLKIPCVGLGWNEKLKMFGKNIGFPERFLEVKELNSENLFNTLQEAIKVDYNEEKRISFEQTQLKSIEEIYKY